MSFSNIKAALITAYQAGSFGLSTAYENRNFTPVKTSPWAQLNLLPVDNVPNTLGDNGLDRFTGIFQIALNYPENSGDGAIMTKADEIRTHFSAGATFAYSGDNVTIRSCGRSQGRNINDMYQIIISVNFHADIARD